MRTSLLLDLVAEAAPERTAIDGPTGRLDYQGLRTAALAFATELAALPGTHVGYLGANLPALPVALFGAAYAGRVFCPLNYRLPDADLKRLALRLAPAVIVADDAMASRIAGIEGVHVLPVSRVRLAADAAGEPSEEGSEIAVQLFTSGTSGEPKAATLKHLNLTSYVLQTVEMLGADEHEGQLVSAPPYHIAGISALLTSVYAGRRIVQLESFQPEAWVDVAARFAATHAMLVPTMLSRVLDVLKSSGTSLDSLQAVSYGGGRMPVETILEALRRMPGVAFVNAYGLTETSSTISLLGPDDHARARAGEPQALKRLGSVGRPIPSVEVEIRDEAGAPVAAGSAGEVWVRGDQVSGEYVGRKVTDESGWFPTRDRGWFDADGYLYLDGRLDDVIVRGGENISPGEIEAVLRTHPAVADAAIVGIKDVQWGERIVAFIARRDGAQVAGDDLKDWVRTRLRSTKAPEEVLFRSELPYNELGKLLRRQLRDQYASGGGA